MHGQVQLQLSSTPAAQLGPGLQAQGWAKVELQAPHAGTRQGWSRPARPVGVLRAPRHSVMSAGDFW